MRLLRMISAAGRVDSRPGAILGLLAAHRRVDFLDQVRPASRWAFFCPVAVSHRVERPIHVVGLVRIVEGRALRCGTQARIVIGPDDRLSNATIAIVLCFMSVHQ